MTSTLIKQLPEDAGVLICGHGSRAKIAEEEFSLLAKGLASQYPSLKVEYGFLEYSAPNIHMALDRLLLRGVNKVYAVPGMLFAATHAQNDIPSVLTTYQSKHAGLEIEYGRELGLSQKMLKAFEARILQALGFTEIPVVGELYDTMLVVVGRGTSVTSANAEVAKLTRIMCENLGFGWSETVYSGVTFPSVGRGLEMAIKLGYKKIVVAPYFLFGGRLIDRIYAYIDKVAKENPEITFSKADYLRDQVNVIDSFVERIEEIISTPGTSQGLLQQFQRRLENGEVDVHHHHAEYQPDESSHSHDQGNSHEHGHSHGHSHQGGHHHERYRHIGHPTGPRTMIGENVCCCFMGQFPQDIIDEEMAGQEELDQVPACKATE
ncbi:MAG: sirohydrochlorin chelatase [Pseudomonadales bacterium]|nr:sirohydrochlorin chelatase [Pseudomonadales bacterium]